MKTPCTDAELPENIRKNRFYDVVPCKDEKCTINANLILDDHNRVKLKYPEGRKSDYINATYIKV